MSMHYQSHKQQANARVQARLQEAELHRLAKQGKQKGGFSVFKTAWKLFGRGQASESVDQTGNVLGAHHQQRYAD